MRWMKTEKQRRKQRDVRKIRIHTPLTFWVVEHFTDRIFYLSCLFCSSVLNKNKKNSILDIICFGFWEIGLKKKKERRRDEKQRWKSEKKRVRVCLSVKVEGKRWCASREDLRQDRCYCVRGCLWRLFHCSISADTKYIIRWGYFDSFSIHFLNAIFCVRSASRSIWLVGVRAVDGMVAEYVDAVSIFDKRLFESSIKK